MFVSLCVFVEGSFRSNIFSGGVQYGLMARLTMYMIFSQYFTCLIVYRSQRVGILFPASVHCYITVAHYLWLLAFKYISSYLDEAAMLSEFNDVCVTDNCGGRQRGAVV